MVAKNPAVNITVHVNDETRIEIQRVPSEDTDFVSVKLGWDVGILLFNQVQAKALMEAAAEAYRQLGRIHLEEEFEKTYSNLYEDLDEIPSYGSNCSITDPCATCVREMELEVGNY